MKILSSVLAIAGVLLLSWVGLEWFQRRAFQRQELERAATFNGQAPETPAE